MLTRAETDAVCTRLRARDREELACYGWTPADAAQAFLQPAVLARAFHDAHGPQALIAFHALTPATLAVSLMATDRWPAVARRVFRWGHASARPLLLARGFRRAECRTLEGHADAIRFLERLGFVRECHVPLFGANGATFIQYAWRLNDHVPLQITQDATAATAAPAPGNKAGGRPAGTSPPGTPPGPVHLAICGDTAGARKSLCAKDPAGWMTHTQSSLNSMTASVTSERPGG